jgi:hypothetical protein
MAENGKAGNVFNDRRGTNPFQPVQSPKLKVRKDHARPERLVESYNGQGNNTPNARALPRYLNGVAISRQNPDKLHTFDTERRLGRLEA